MANAFDMIQPGTLIGDRHRVVRLLGQGGMGAVYEAENTWTSRRVAIKILHPMYSSDPTSVERFKGEAQAATRLAHPNIVDVLDMGADPQTGALYIVQEFLRGSDLYAFLEKRGALEPAETAEIMVPVMAALATAHERNIIHRDLKPENIFLVTTGTDITPKLIDFGLSKVLGDDGPNRRTVTGTVMGTPYYMSPEQARGDRAVDARTDIWAIGAVLFEMISGKVPYDEPSANLIMLKIITSPPPRLADVMPHVDGGVAAIVSRAMEPEVSKRYPTMRALLDDVLACPGFQRAAQRATLRERFSRSIEHQPPPDSPAPLTNTGSASLVSAPTMAPVSVGPLFRPSAPPPQSVPPTEATGVGVAARGTNQSWEEPRHTSVVQGRRGVALAVVALVIAAVVGGVVVQFATRSTSSLPRPTTAGGTETQIVAPTQSPTVPVERVNPVVASPDRAVGDAGPPRAEAPVVTAANHDEAPDASASTHSSRRRRRHRSNDALAPAEPP